MYAQVSNSQLVNATEGHSLHRGDGSVVSNPTPEQLASEGFYPVPDIPDGKVATAWSLVDGALVPTLADPPAEVRPDSWIVSRNALGEQAAALGVLDKLIDLINSDKTVSFFWYSSNEINTANPRFTAAKPSIATALGITADRLEDALWAARIVE